MSDTTVTLTPGAGTVPDVQVPNDWIAVPSYASGDIIFSPPVRVVRANEAATVVLRTAGGHEVSFVLAAGAQVNGYFTKLISSGTTSGKSFCAGV